MKVTDYCKRCGSSYPLGLKVCIQCGNALEQPSTPTNTNLDEVLNTVGAIILYFVLTVILQVMSRGNTSYFLIGIAPVIFLAVRLYLSVEKNAARHAFVRLLAVASMFIFFFSSQYAGNKNKTSTIDFVRQTAAHVDRICKESSKCPETIDGFSCKDNFSGVCSIQKNGYTIYYRYSYPDHYNDKNRITIQEFSLGGKLDGYETFYINGGTTKPLTESHRHSS